MSELQPGQQMLSKQVGTTRVFDARPPNPIYAMFRAPEGL
jgi:hypothetical protein